MEPHQRRSGSSWPRRAPLVTGLHLGAADTDMMAGFDVPKPDPAEVVATALDGVEAGLLEVIADDDTAQVKAALAGDLAAMYPQLG